jgi:hypothetical protein
MMQPSAFGVLFIAGTLLLVAFVWSPFAGLAVGGRAPAIDEKEALSLLH